ncbi:hypothetical protein GCM10010174_88270 [Kutzneria viridogrisea]
MLHKRVVVTGLGAVSSIGTGAVEFTEGLRTGRSGVSPITAFDTTGYAHTNGCQVPEFEPERWLRRLSVPQWGRASQYAAAAGRMAMADAGLTEQDLSGARCQVCVGTTDGESHDLGQLTAVTVEHGPQAMEPLRTRRIPSSRLSMAVACDEHFDPLRISRGHSRRDARGLARIG